VQARSVCARTSRWSSWGLVRDVTAALQAKQREEFYREIFDATSDAIFIHDEQGRVLDVNLGAVPVVSLRPRHAHQR